MKTQQTRPSMVWGLVAGLAAAWLAAAGMARADDGATVEFAEPWANLFSGAEVKLHYTVRTPAALDGRLNWSLSVNRRTVEHGELPLKVEPGRTAETTIAFRVPEVKEGVILEAQLGVAAYAAGQQKPVAENARKIWIFPHDPFAGRKQWLKDLKITLFDPEGKTADVLEKARVPFKFTKNVAALDNLGEGILLVGEGTAWRDHRGLGEALVKAAARGVPVLCLAPGEGSLVLPGAEGADPPAPKSLALRQADVIAELDKRLDAVAWPPQGKIVATGLAVKSDRDQVVAEATRDGRGWPWLEARYAAPRGRLIVCGFGIVRQWEAAPAARYLLSELFSRLGAAKQVTPSQEERKD